MSVVGVARMTFRRLPSSMRPGSFSMAALKKVSPGRYMTTSSGDSSNWSQ